MRHFEARSGYAPGIRRLARRIENFMVLVGFDRFGRGRHVGPLRDADAAVGDQHFRLLAAHFVLGCARQCDIAFDAPGTLAFVIGGCRVALGVFFDASAEDIFQFQHVFQLFGVDSFRVVNITRRIG